MRWQDGDGGDEILCRVVDFLHEEVELPSEGVEPGTDLSALGGLESVRELCGGGQEVLQADHRAGVVARLRGAEQGIGDITGGASLDHLLDQFLQGPLGAGSGRLNRDAASGRRTPGGTGRGSACPAVHSWA